jgi:hypothetical protein
MTPEGIMKRTDKADSDLSVTGKPDSDLVINLNASDEMKQSIDKNHLPFPIEK